MIFERYPIAYDLFEGDIYEGHTLIPILKKFEKRFDLKKPIVIADAGLLSKDNIKNLVAEGYRYILGGRIKNESKKVKEAILKEKWVDSKAVKYDLSADKKLIVSYSNKRAKKDADWKNN